MLEAARNLRNSGTEVVVGYIEPHGRLETERLIDGFEVLPPLTVRYRGMVRKEFDLDAALRRRPHVLLVDELAHSNPIEGEPAPRHAKRWQDIEELLDAGITVWTTVNVQHLESLNDLVAQITGIRQRETFPDRIFAEADDIELIDLPPDDLLARLRAGKIYLPEQAGTAVERFFRKPNLIALRELALRRVADRVDAAAQVANSTQDRSSRPWLARDRLLVAVGPDTQAEQLVRAGKRMADALDAEWIVVFVETPELLQLSAEERDRRISVLRLGESLGAETVTLDGPSAWQVLQEYALTRRATRVLVGAPKQTGWRALLRPSTTRQLLRHARGFDIVVVALPEAAVELRRTDSLLAQPGNGNPVPWPRYAGAALISLLCTAIAFLMYPHVELTNLVMVYVLGAAIAAVRHGRGPGVLASFLNVAVFDFCFVPPQFTFAVSDAEYLLTFAVMLIVTLVIGTLMASVRQQTRVAGARERRTALLYAMSRELAAARDVPEMIPLAVRHVAEVFESEVAVLLPDASGRIAPQGEAGTFEGADLAIAQWVADHGRRAGLGSDTLPAAPALYLPLGHTKGVLAVLPANRRRVLLPEQRHLLETFAGQIGLALERGRLAESAEQARLAAETEGLRNTLLASISHDLRSPLSVIAGAASTLAERDHLLDAGERTSLARSIEEKAREMTDLIGNVLELTRLESGQLTLRLDWQSVEDMVNEALTRMRERLRHHEVRMKLAADLPAVKVDASLVVQALTNLLDNAAKYTPAGTRVTLEGIALEDAVRLVVADDGPGFPPGDVTRLLDKFQRGTGEGTIAGAGLGLSICRAIVLAHGGRIDVERPPGGGARIAFTLPTQS